MAGVPVARPHTGNNLDPFVVVHRPERAERRDCIGLRIDRRDFGAAARRIAAVELRDFGFLDAAGVGQHVGAQVDGALRGQDRPVKTIADQFRQQAAMVDMGVG